MPKCVICKALNVRSEAARHPNLTTLMQFRIQLMKIKNREEKALASICEEHRNPLVFNTVVINLFDSAKILATYAERGVPVRESELKSALSPGDV